MNKARQDSLLGVVFFAALGLLLWATFALTDLSLGERPSIEVYCANAGGIRSGDPVYVLGNRNGQVASVEYQRNAPAPSQRIKMTLQLRDAVTLRRDAEIMITAANLLGGKIIEIDPGIATEVWGSDIVIATLQRSGLDALSELLDDEELQDNFREIVSGLRRTVDQLNSTDGTIGQLINTTDLHDEFLAATQSARKSLEELEKNESLLGRLFYDSELGDDGKRLIADAADIITDAKNGVGTIGRLLRSDELAEKVEQTIDAFLEVGQNAADPEKGLLGALISDPELAAQGRRILDDIEAVTQSLRSGDGTLARLINDPEMGEQLSRILNQVSRAIEDAREAAPIGTFFQVLTGSF